MIKYDKRQVKILGVAGSVSLVLFIVGFILMITEPSFVKNGGSFMLIMLIAMYFSGPVAFFGIINYFAGKDYLKQLEEYGYELPNDKSLYQNDLERLPVDEKKYQETVERYSKNRVKYCVYISAIFVVAFICCMIWDLKYCIEWELLPDIVEFTLFWSIFDLILLLYAWIYWRQSDAKKYRNAVERSAIKKVRKSRYRAIAEVIILVLLVLLAKNMLVSMQNYTFKAKIASTKDSLDSLGNGIANAYAEYENKAAIDRLLAEGVYIDAESMPEQIFWENTLNYIEFDNYRDVLNTIKVTKQPPKVLVKFEDETVIVTLMNPIKKAGGAISRYIDINADDENLLFKLNHQE